MSGSNLRLFFIISALLLITLSCNKEKNNVIPNVYVDFYVDLKSDPYFFDLVSAITNSTYVSASTNNWGIKSAGYDGNGIIIYHADDYEYYAYDRTCPHCFATSQLSKAVNIDFLFAVCPECGTNYALPGLGVPTAAGPGQYQLKQYRAAISGQSLHVWNRY